MISRSTLYIAVFCTFLALLGGVAAFRNLPAIQDMQALWQLKNCARERDAAMCSKPIIARLLKSHSGAEIMDMLEENVEAGVCHYMGHVVGQQSYIMYRDIDPAVSRCNIACESACEHGVVGEAFAQALGFDSEDIDLKHLSPEEIEKVGPKLCQTSQPCHGVGHTLFQIYERFDPALEACSQIATPRTRPFCFTGVFMEYADILTSRNMRVVPEVSYPDATKLSTFCTEFELKDARRACFLYFPRIARAALGSGWTANLARVKAICESYTGDNRVACFVGIGGYNSYQVAADSPYASALCESLSLESDKAACNLGEISYDVESRPVNVFNYCARLSTDVLKKTCYQGIFAKLNQRGVRVADFAKRFCGTNDMCLRSAEDFLIDPWSQIPNNFIP